MNRFVAIPGTETIPPVEAPIPMEVPAQPAANYNAIHLQPIGDVPAQQAANYNAIHLQPFGDVPAQPIEDVTMALGGFANTLDDIDIQYL